jgi:hypothetical protein
VKGAAPKIASTSSVRPRALQPGHPDDLTGPQGEVD